MESKSPLTRGEAPRPLPHTVGERWKAVHFVELYEIAEATPLPHRVGERSPKVAQRHEAGEGVLFLPFYRVSLDFLERFAGHTQVI
jgi:hypothetical protein